MRRSAPRHVDEPSRTSLRRGDYRFIGRQHYGNYSDSDSGIPRLRQVERCVSPHGNDFAFGIRRDATQSLLAADFENQRNCLGETLTRCFLRAALAIRARDLWTIGNDPVVVVFEDGLVMHDDLSDNLPSSGVPCLTELRVYSAVQEAIHGQRFRGTPWSH